VKLIVPLLGLLFLTSCELAHTMMEQPGDREREAKANQAKARESNGRESSTREATEPSRPKSSAKLEKHVEVFTGTVVLDDGAYRLQLDDGTLMRLTRGRRETEFESGQILLRKYYEKKITVNGTRQDDWIWGADITGQYVPPGAPTGPNMNAPKQTRP
jgi:hypothetical protein